MHQILVVGMQVTMIVGEYTLIIDSSYVKLNDTKRFVRK